MTRRDNGTYNRNYNGNRNPNFSRANNTSTEEHQKAQDQVWNGNENHENYENEHFEEYENESSWANNSRSQSNYNLITNEQLMMLLDNRNSPKPTHSANFGRVSREPPTTHDNEKSGTHSYCFHSSVNDQMNG